MDFSGRIDDEIRNMRFYLSFFIYLIHKIKYVRWLSDNGSKIT